MRQVWISGTGGPEKLELREAPDPAPTAGTLRVQVRASGINFADILARQGLYPDAPKIPCVVGYEVSGTVDAVGDGVDAVWIGKDVFGLTRFGGYADVVIAPVEQMFEKPAVLTHEQAAAIPVLLRSARNEERGVLEVHERRETQRCAKAAGPAGCGQNRVMRRCSSVVWNHQTPSSRLA